MSGCAADGPSVAWLVFWHGHTDNQQARVQGHAIWRYTDTIDYGHKVTIHGHV